MFVLKKIMEIIDIQKKIAIIKINIFFQMELEPFIVILYLLIFI